MKTTLLLALTLAFGFLAVPGLAHHGWAAFDSDVKVTLKGTVTDFHFINPHSVVEFEVKDSKGQVQAWEGELTSPSHLIPAGWTRNSLDKGDVVTITGYPAKSGTHVVRITKLVLANGKELKMGSID
jgi:hypothetical protein